MKPERYLTGAVLGLALVVAPIAATSAAAAGPPAQLSIAIDNDHASVEVGDELTYTLTVQNLGADPVGDLSVTQSMPPGLEFGSADSAGTAGAGKVRWLLSIEANSEVTVTTTMTVAETSETLLRLASVACASVAADEPPTVCATDSDQLPAGASAEAEQAEPGGTGPSVVILGSVAAGVLVLIGVLFLVLLPRWRRRALAR